MKFKQGSSLMTLFLQSLEKDQMLDVLNYMPYGNSFSHHSTIWTANGTLGFLRIMCQGSIKLLWIGWQTDYARKWEVFYLIIFRIMLWVQYFS